MRESDPRDARVIEGLRAARSCDRGTDRPPTAYGVRVVGPEGAPDIAAVTDEGGRFCFRARLVPDRHLAHLSWRGSNLVDAADQDLAFDLSRQALILRFDPTPRIVSLDTPRIALEAAALVEDDGATQAKPGGHARPRERDRGARQGDHRRVGPSTLLGPRHAARTARARPAQGLVRGDAQTAFSVHVADVERRVKVTLRVPAAEKGDLKPQVPEEGIPLAVDVASTMGPVRKGPSRRASARQWSAQRRSSAASRGSR